MGERVKEAGTSPSRSFTVSGTSVAGIGQRAVLCARVLPESSLKHSCSVLPTGAKAVRVSPQRAV